ncbi:MAG: MBL fold metallo-hydrolase [Lachnospiraceae bacterium]|nr:MBL fold metallo-hydrolase [Lachnospiraceae bacterium]
MFVTGGGVVLVSRLKYGNTNTFFIRGTAGNLLVDTDYAGTLSLFYKEIKRQNISLKDITYILATHYHPDHIGLVSELMKQGVKLLLVDAQREYVGFSDEIFAREKRTEVESIQKEEATVITCEGSRVFLRTLGIDGEIISTTSHSEDSVTLILDDGTCFVGDLEPMEYLGAYEENEKLAKDWERILSFQPKRICYAHANEKVFEM